MYKYQLMTISKYKSILGVVFSLVIISSVFAAPVSASPPDPWDMHSIPEDSSFESNESTVSGSVTYTTDGYMTMTEGSTYTSSTFNLSENVRSVEIGWLNEADVDGTLKIYDANTDELLAQNTGMGGGSGGYPVEFISTTTSSVYIVLEVSDDSDGTPDEQITFSHIQFSSGSGYINFNSVTDSNGQSISSFDYTIVDSSGTQIDSGTASPNDSIGMYKVGDYDVTVSATDYDSSTKTISVPDHWDTVNADFTLSGGPDGDIEISSVTDLENNLVGTFEYVIKNADTGEIVYDSTATDSVVESVQPGTYDVSVSKEGYSTVTKTYSVESNTTTQNSFILNRTTGSLEIFDVVNGHGSSVSFDYSITDSEGSQVESGSDISAPYSTIIPTGDYTVEVTKDNYTTDTYTYTITQSSETSHTFTIEEKVVTVSVGSVEDMDGGSIDPIDIEVVDSSSGSVVKSQSGVSAPYSFADLPAGVNYEVTVSSSGYKAETKTYSVPVGGAKEKIFQLYSNSESSKVDLVITSGEGDPISDATVEISQDGTVVTSDKTDENGSVSISELNNGDYTVTVDKSGYKSVSTSLSLDSDKSLEGNLFTDDSTSSSTLSEQDSNDLSGGGVALPSTIDLRILAIIAMVFVFLVFLRLI